MLCGKIPEAIWGRNSLKNYGIKFEGSLYSRTACQIKSPRVALFTLIILSTDEGMHVKCVALGV